MFGNRRPSDNEIKDMKMGTIVIVPEKDKVTIGKLRLYHHPEVRIEGVNDVFPENIVYRADQERLMLVGVPERLSEGIMNGSAKLPIIGEGD